MVIPCCGREYIALQNPARKLPLTCPKKAYRFNIAFFKQYGDSGHQNVICRYIPKKYSREIKKRSVLTHFHRKMSQKEPSPLAHDCNESERTVPCDSFFCCFNANFIDEIRIRVYNIPVYLLQYKMFLVEGPIKMYKARKFHEKNTLCD